MVDHGLIMHLFLTKRISYCQALEEISARIGTRLEAHVILNMAWEHQIMDKGGQDATET